MGNTPNRNYPLPVATNNVSDDVGKLEAALSMVDGDVDALFDAINDLAPIIHTHAIADVVGLQGALDGKAASGHVHALDNLTDVSGAAGAADGYILWKSAGGWMPVSPVAALGVHGHTIAQVTGLQSALDTKAAIASVVLQDAAQSLSDTQQSQARSNVGVNNWLKLVEYGEDDTVATRTYATGILAGAEIGPEVTVTPSSNTAKLKVTFNCGAIKLDQTGTDNDALIALTLAYVNSSAVYTPLQSYLPEGYCLGWINVDASYLHGNISMAFVLDQTHLDDNGDWTFSFWNQPSEDNTSVYEVELTMRRFSWICEEIIA